MRRKAIPLAIGMVAGLSLIFRVGPADAEPGVFEDKIVFGQSAAFKGPAAALGLGMRDGILAAFEEAMEQGKVGVMSPETLEKYNAAKKTLAAANKALEDWMEANRRKRPTPELNKQYNDLRKVVTDAQTALDAF